MKENKRIKRQIETIRYMVEYKQLYVIQVNSIYGGPKYALVKNEWTEFCTKDEILIALGHLGIGAHEVKITELVRSCDYYKVDEISEVRNDNTYR